VSQKSSPSETFRNIFIQAKYISVKFCKCVATLHQHIFTNQSWLIYFNI